MNDKAQCPLPILHCAMRQCLWCWRKITTWLAHVLPAPVVTRSATGVFLYSACRQLLLCFFSLSVCVALTNIQCESLCVWCWWFSECWVWAAMLGSLPPQAPKLYRRKSRALPVPAKWTHNVIFASFPETSFKTVSAFLSTSDSRCHPNTLTLGASRLFGCPMSVVFIFVCSPTPPHAQHISM